MIKHVMTITASILLLAGIVGAQEVYIPGFPINVAGSVEDEFFEPYHDQLQAVADSLAKYPMARAIVTGGADGFRYREYNDAKNPGIALGRAHRLRNLLVQTFDVDSTQIIVQSEDVSPIGDRYRFASVRIDWSLVQLDARIDSIPPPLPPAPDTHITVVNETNYFGDDLLLQAGGGLSTSPFGGLPFISGALTLDHQFGVEVMLGHSFFNKDFRTAGIEFDTRLRLVGAHAFYYPLDSIPVAVVGGWMRVEQIAKDFNQYVQLSEGPSIGLRATPFDFIAGTLLYNPAKHRVVGRARSDTNGDQFLFIVTAYFTFGGER